jgi:membrane-associated phospholipid phosphatase
VHHRLSMPTDTIRSPRLWLGTALDSARRALTAQRALKVRLTIVLTLYFCVPYVTLQHALTLPARRLPLGAIDLAVPFMPAWVWVYQSVYVLMYAVPWCAVSTTDLRRYARGFVLQASIGFLFFLLIPIEAPRPNVVPDDPMFRVLLMYDGLVNSFPSMHVGLAVYTVLFAARASHGRIASRVRVALLSVLWIWVAAIAFSTLATKQHYFMDLPAGAALAWLCQRWTWRDL